MKTRHLIAAITLVVLPLTAACDPATPDNKPTHSAAKTEASPAVETTEEATPEYIDPTADNFEVTLKTTHRQCFGYGVGCNVTVKPELTFLDLGGEKLDPDKTYEITYEITGDESGPVIDTMTLSDGSSLNFHETDLSTPSSATKTRIKITDVQETL